MQKLFVYQIFCLNLIRNKRNKNCKNKKIKKIEQPVSKYGIYFNSPAEDIYVLIFL